MHEIYPRWVAAHGIMIMIDRMVCADGGNPDRHLAGRSYSVVVHGDSAGTEVLRRSLSDWLNDMQLIQAGGESCIDRFIDYYGKYATSHDALDQDEALQEEVRNAARSLITHVTQRRAGVQAPDENLQEPRPK